MAEKIAIIGGGASGLALANILDERFDVTVYERGDRVGKKILATGNGRCNLANTELLPSRFLSKDTDKIAEILEGYSYTDIKDFFENLGLLVRCESEGRVYPLSNQATAVLDVLRFGAAQKGVDIKCGFLVKKLSKKGDCFEILSENGERAAADEVILALGGMASPKTGSDGIGYNIAKSFGHTVTALSPALVPLKSDTSFTAPLKGIRAKASVTLNGDITENGEIQFTDYGISGIAAMQLSRHLTGKDSITIDFASDYSTEHILSLLKRASDKNLPIGELYSGILSRRVGEELIKRVLKKGLATTSGTLSDTDLLHLAEAVKGLTLPVNGTLSWDNAQVTSGGIPLSEIDCKTMKSRFSENLYLMGELLDCDGECGGYNLSFAWITALKVGKALNERFI